ncbi:MAG: aminotransferase DegT [Chloroflexi bacterium RBG_13_53_26]|nr:MAG: aminotransferase DegT [Chloroflexi bacterium RBG_13_53_26]
MIPVCEPLLTGKELDYVADCLRTNWVSSMGKYIAQFETQFASYCGCKHGVSTTNGTAALHLALASLGIGLGDEVIVPAFTMAASVFSIIYTGAKPVLVDSEPETWNLAVSKIEEKVTTKTKAIMPVHIYGHPCDIDPIMQIAKRHGLSVVEDAAEAHGAWYKSRKAGGVGDVGCFSFYANKIITTGEGGMLVTNDDRIAERARRLKDQAYSPAMRFLHTDLGFNYRMTNIQAAIGLAQLENIDVFVDLRRKNAFSYNAALGHLPGITLPPEKEWARSVYWMYSILIGDDFGVGRNELMQRLKEKGIDTRPFFIPMHMQPAFLTMGLFKEESYPIAEDLSRRGLYLPSGSGLRDEDLNYVCRSIREIADSP